MRQWPEPWPARAGSSGDLDVCPGWPFHSERICRSEVAHRRFGGPDAMPLDGGGFFLRASAGEVFRTGPLRDLDPELFLDLRTAGRAPQVSLGLVWSLPGGIPMSRRFPIIQVSDLREIGGISALLPSEPVIGMPRRVFSRIWS